jgi:hypothetical protein
MIKLLMKVISKKIRRTVTRGVTTLMHIISLKNSLCMTFVKVLIPPYFYLNESQFPTHRKLHQDLSYQSVRIKSPLFLIVSEHHYSLARCPPHVKQGK